ncbi:MAG: paraquat-inducible protein A [Bacteroidetes bacterium]|nr:MAG: paraquat-inducible protein A [Bacteroidota bacterium]
MLFSKKLAVLLIIIVIICGFCGYKVYELSRAQERVKADYSIINNISFGLLSVSEWRDQIEDIVTQKIADFKLTSDQKKDLQRAVENILHTLIRDITAKINKPSRTLGGKIKSFAFRALVDTSSLQKQVPSFSQKIIEQIENPSNRKKLKKIAQSKLEELGEETYDSATQDRQHITDSLFKKYNVKDQDEFGNKTEALLHSLRLQTYAYAISMLAMVVAAFIVWLMVKKNPQLRPQVYLFSIFIAFILLLVGVNTTMIELDARINSLHFHLLNSEITFKNQVLFFQSKSILDVVRLLIKTGKIDMVLVGILVLCFSVMFPVSKLVASCIHLFGNERWANNKVVHFFAFKSGKWSMADVTVVAIMMTYIGFNGVVENQLEDLNINTDLLTSVATNNTSLQPGYIVFVGFVLYALFLSAILDKIRKPESKIAPLNANIQQKEAQNF